MKESDWKLFRSKFPLWVERYMEKVCEEYKQILKSDTSACEKYNAISDRINADGRKAAFPIRNSRNPPEIAERAVRDMISEKHQHETTPR